MTIGNVVVALLGLALVTPSTSHICLLSPRQRGALDISVGASPTCTRHGEPCGGQDPEEPKVVFSPGSTAFIKWQQNLNHYEPGYPGYMDISIAFSANSTDFTPLAVVTDRYVHSQYNQQNYTAVVKMPMHICNHCVIRARYNAHKPGESPFIQCADVMIEPPPPGLKYTPTPIPKEKEYDSIRKAVRFTQRRKHVTSTDEADVKLYGFAYNPFQRGRTGYVSISTTTGQITKVNELNFGIDTPSDGDRVGFILDEIIAVDYLRNTSVILVHDFGTRDDAAKEMYTIGSMNGSVVEYSNIYNFDGSPINAMTWYTEKNYVTFSLEPSKEKEGYFNFVLGIIDGDNSYEKVAQADKPEGLYVNFQWLEKDLNNHNAYVLIGDENSLDKLSARIYSYDVYNRKYLGMVEVDVSKYTFSSMHSAPQSDVLYAFSPGLHGDAVATWSLVAVDPKTGNVNKKCDVAPPGVFDRYYGGSVYSGSYNQLGRLYHILRVANSDADVIVSVDPNTCHVTFSELTNLRHIHSLTRLCSLDNLNNCFLKN